MLARILTGVVLVLGSWVVLAVIVVGMGRWAAVLVGRRRSRRSLLRASIWWGLGVLSILALTVNQVMPLGNGSTLAVVLAIGVILALLGAFIHRPRLPRRRRPSAGGSALLAAGTVGLVYLAYKALGPVTNYDTGLYHLGAVKYGYDFSAIPGLANLFFPFGYANAQFPIASLLGAGPWDGTGYRLLNGLLVVLVFAEVAIRLTSRRRTWGTYALAVGFSACAVPLIGMADALVASPTSDTSVLLLTLIAATYLADILERRRDSALEVSVVVVVCCVAVAMRPTMLAYAFGVLVVLVLVLVRRPQARPQGWAPWAMTGFFTAVIVAAVVLRDRTLSGWLLYPLSIFSFSVPWRAPDPTPWRDATLAAARDATAADQYVVAHSWGWIPNWIGRLPVQWETWFIVTGVVVTIVIAAVAHQRVGFPSRPPRILAAVLPSLIALAVWFAVSPPSFRFIWGPLFVALFLVLGAALQALDSADESRRSTRPTPWQTVLVASAAVIVAVTAYSAVARNQASSITEEASWTLGPVGVPYAIAPVPLPPTTELTLPSGFTVSTPESGSDQCWGNYPLCTFNPIPQLLPRGTSIQDGFTASR